MSKQLTGFGINPNNSYEIYAEHHEKMVTMGPVQGHEVGANYPAVTFMGTLKFAYQILQAENDLTAGEDEIGAKLIEKIDETVRRFKYSTLSNGSVKISYGNHELVIKTKEIDLEPVTVGGDTDGQKE